MNLDLPHGVSQSLVRVPRRLRGKQEKIDMSIDWMEQKKKIGRKKTRRRTKSVKKATWTTSRCRAAVDANSYLWKFVKVSDPVCDVDIENYPYELVRKSRLSDDEIENEKQKCQQIYFQECLHQWQQEDGMSVSHSQQEKTTASFMETFDSDYIQTAASAMLGLKVEGKLKVKAYFGRTLFRLHKLYDHGMYRLSNLHGCCAPSDFQSSWSNVFDHTAPVMRRLIDRLAQAGKLNTQESKTRLAIRIGYKSVNGFQRAFVTYYRTGNTWVLSKVESLSDASIYHDISLENQTNFRVKVYSKNSETSVTSWWNSVPNFLLLNDVNGDPFSTEVSLLSCPDKKLKIEFATIKKVLRPVKYRGLIFQLSTSQGCMFLKARPSVEILAEKQADKCFEVLVSRLVDIFAELKVDSF